MNSNRLSGQLRRRLRLRLEQLRARVGRRCTTTWARAAFWSWGVRPGRGLVVRGTLKLYLAGDVHVEPGVSMNSGRANFVGGDRRMALWVGPRGVLHIGEGCGLSNTTISCFESITLRAGTFVGGGCEIYDWDFHQLDPDDRLANRGPVKSAPIDIGPRAFIGGWSIILKGVSIGEAAIVGAGSVVTKSIPPFEIWAGVPARFVGKVPRKELVSAPEPQP
jgi:acetyltransferase-like isoleucine patch superfamily enzyme